MKAILLLILMIAPCINAMDFQEFRQKTVENSNILKSEKLSTLLEQKRADLSQSIQNDVL